MAGVLDRDAARRRLLGWSAACPVLAKGVDLGRDLVLRVDPVTGKRDLARVEAIDALSQSLELAFTTLKGSDVFNVGFGFDGLNALAEEENPVLARERIRVAAIAVLQREPRVRRVLDVKLGEDRLGVPRSATRMLEVRVSFETVSGDAETATLGRLGPGG